MTMDRIAHHTLTPEDMDRALANITARARTKDMQDVAEREVRELREAQEAVLRAVARYGEVRVRLWVENFGKDRW